MQNVLNEGEVEDEKTLDLSSKDGGEIVEVNNCNIYQFINAE